MSEYTVRNKAKNPIVTLRPAVMEAMLAARPESSSLVLSKYCKDYKNLTGKVVHIDYEQNQALLERYGADSSGGWKSEFLNIPAPWFRIERCFVDGFLAQSLSASLLDGLAVAEAFFDMLERELKTQQGE